MIKRILFSAFLAVTAVIAVSAQQMPEPPFIQGVIADDYFFVAKTKSTDFKADQILFKAFSQETTQTKEFRHPRYGRDSRIRFLI